MASKAKQDLVPRREAESSATVAGKLLNNRARALVDQAFDLLEKGAQDAEGRDFAKALAAAILRDPLGAIERVIRLTPSAEAQTPIGGILNNINNLYLNAVVQANQAAPAAAPAIEGEYVQVEPGTSRVQPSVSDWD